MSITIKPIRNQQSTRIEIIGPDNNRVKILHVYLGEAHIFTIYLYPKTNTLQRKIADVSADYMLMPFVKEAPPDWGMDMATFYKWIIDMGFSWDDFLPILIGLRWKIK